MKDPAVSETSELRVWVSSVPGDMAMRTRDEVVGSALKSGVEVLVLRADMVFGSDHLKSALYHAKKAINEGRNASDSLSMETLLYASGERQLGTAIRKMSVDSSCSEIVIAQLTRGRLEPGKSWRPLEAVAQGTLDSSLERFGISKNELATVSSAKKIDLVLEKVAAVDILKK